jgi:hypothetical protein
MNIVSISSKIIQRNEFMRREAKYKDKIKSLKDEFRRLQNEMDIMKQYNRQLLNGNLENVIRSIVKNFRRIVNPRVIFIVSTKTSS